MTFDHLDSIDWDESLRLAGNNPALAQELLTRLAASLPNELAIIQKAYHDQNLAELTRCVHKLRGGLSYTGLVRLKAISSALETGLKSNIMGSLASLISQLDDEIRSLLEYITHHPVAMAAEPDKLASSSINDD